MLITDRRVTQRKFSQTDSLSINETCASISTSDKVVDRSGRIWYAPSMKNFTKPELDGLLAAARKESEADYLMFLVMFNHGLRVSEMLALSASNIVGNFLVVQRLKGSKKTCQPLLPSERDGLLKLPANGFFAGEYRMSVHRKIRKYGAIAGIPEFKLHAHTLKHTTGRLGYEGGMGIPELQAYLGHVNGKNTMVYLEATEEQAALAFAAAVGRQ
jgi:integrase